MDTETLELLCQKLGTTIENIIPAAIEYGIYDAKYTLKVGIIVSIFGIACAIVACFIYYRDSHSSSYEDHFVLIIIFAILALFAIVFSLFFTIYGIIETHYWSVFPEMQAYKMILGWVK